MRVKEQEKEREIMRQVENKERAEKELLEQERVEKERIQKEQLKKVKVHITGDEYIIEVSHILLEEQLGAGSYDILLLFFIVFLLVLQGEVCKGKWKGSEVAVKKIFLQVNEVWPGIILSQKLMCGRIQKRCEEKFKYSLDCAILMSLNFLV